jgi:hypothetical protein
MQSIMKRAALSAWGKERRSMIRGAPYFRNKAKVSWAFISKLSGPFTKERKSMLAVALSGIFDCHAGTT